MAKRKVRSKGKKKTNLLHKKRLSKKKKRR